MELQDSHKERIENYKNLDKRILASMIYLSLVQFTSDGETFNNESMEFLREGGGEK